MREPNYFVQVQQILQSIHGKTLTVEERKEFAIKIAATLLRQARKEQTVTERRLEQTVARMLDDPNGRALTTALTDQGFRSKSSKRIADQIGYLIDRYGVPRFLPAPERFAFNSLRWATRPLLPLATTLLRRVMRGVVLPGETEPLRKHLRKRKREGVRVNLNRLGEAILGEEEAAARVALYLDDLTKTDVECISVKISTICSQINPLAWNATVEALADRLRSLYRSGAFVNLDMEAYTDLHITCALFRKVLDEPEFFATSAGIVLQAYLPESFPLQQELTEWAMARVAQGGAPIRLRVVRGANLAMERVEASINGWPQAPYSTKDEVDANFKRMITYGFAPSRAQAVHLGVATHNLFDIAYAFCLRAENAIEELVDFEMLEGMADPLRRVVQRLAGGMLLYCPAVKEEDFQNAVAYLVRRLDENTGPENFLRHMFGLSPGSPSWEDQAERFLSSCDAMEEVSRRSRRRQNRFVEPEALELTAPFANEPPTDWSLSQNIRWGQEILSEWQTKQPAPITPFAKQQRMAEGFDPSRPKVAAYSYALADRDDVEAALRTAKEAEPSWSALSAQDRSELMAEVAQLFRRHRKELIGAMVLDGGKTLPEADPEVSEAIDFLEYYRRQMEELSTIQNLTWKPKGTVVVTPPWNFPCAIPTGSIAAALICGNVVIFKPAPETTLVGAMLAQLFWQAGVPKQVLQLFTCAEEPEGSLLIQDPRVNAVILTGGTATARTFLQMRPRLDLFAETGGKNTFIISNLADRDLAIADLIHSAFGHAGQKCSAASLAIVHAELYDDPRFMRALKDAASSLPVGSAWDPRTRVNPLIRSPNETLLRSFTTLEPGEEWLIEPHQNPDIPNLWSPGIKLGVSRGSFTHQTELFGPVLGVMRAPSITEAIDLANDTPYGLTAGIHTLDDREITRWLETIEAGNLYVNRTITGAIVRRQPFGGTKASSFGPGAKVGGPNYLPQLMQPVELGLPQQIAPLNDAVNSVRQLLTEWNLPHEDLTLFDQSVGNYAYWHEQLRREEDPSQVLGEANFLHYVPRRRLTLRIHGEAAPLDVARSIAAALTCTTPLEISWNPEEYHFPFSKWEEQLGQLHFVAEDEMGLLKRVERGEVDRLRTLAPPSDSLVEVTGTQGVYTASAKVLAYGRFELLHYLREVAISITYHRHGNVGSRPSFVPTDAVTATHKHQ